MTGDTFRINLGKLLSLAPAGLSRDGAETILRENNGNVRRALKAAKRGLAATDESIVVPVPDLIDATTGSVVQFKNLRNVQNSCYMAATITACFAHWDAWDALLTAPQEDPKNAALRDDLRKIVNGIRRNGSRVPTAHVRKLRDYILPGYSQECAGEFFEELLGKLSGPMLPFGLNLHHPATREDGDESTEALRTVDLTFRPEMYMSRPGNNRPDDSCDLADMMYDYHFVNQYNVRRKHMNRDAIVNAWCVKLLLPEYSPYSEDRNLRRNSFDTLAIPFCLKRYQYDIERKRPMKIRNPVVIPVNLDFSRFVSNNNDGRSGVYSLRLKSIVCHKGGTLNTGHYVSYTYDLATGWKRWDDISDSQVDTCAGDITGDQLPMNRSWREEIARDSYLVFYELLPGDGNEHPKDALDSSISGEISDVSASTSGGIMESIVEKVKHHDDEQVARALQAELNGTEYDFTEDTARRMQEDLDSDYARSVADEAEAKRIQANMDAQYARELSQRESRSSQTDDEELARSVDAEMNGRNDSNSGPRGSNMPPPPSDSSSRRRWR